MINTEQIKLGDKVRVKDNAFEGSLHVDDILTRGQVGIVIGVFGNEIEVQTDNDFLRLTVDEVEAIGE